MMVIIYLAMSEILKQASENLAVASLELYIIYDVAN